MRISAFFFQSANGGGLRQPVCLLLGHLPQKEIDIAEFIKGQIPSHPHPIVHRRLFIQMGAEMQKKIPSTMDRLLEKKNLELLETRNFNLRQENKELKEALEEERSFSDRLLEGIDRVLDMLERHLPKQLLHLVDKARDLLPEHQTYRQEKQHERGHSWGDMSL